MKNSTCVIALISILCLVAERARAAGAPIIGGSKLYISSSGATSADGYTYTSPNGLPTTVYFQWGLTTNYGNSTTGQVINGDFQFVTVPTITGLEPAVTYSARAVASNSSGVAYSLNEVFTTANPGLAATLAPTNITDTTAMLRGFAYPSGASPATAYFQYGQTGGGHPVMFTPSQILTNAANRTLVTAMVSNLVPGAQYFFDLTVTTTSTGYGADVTFLTGANAPILQTSGATEIAAVAAKLIVGVNPNGLATSLAFQWGLTTDYGNYTALQTLPTTLTSLSATSSLGQLTPATTYHFRAVATNGMGVTLGADQTFTTTSTNPPTVITGLPTGVTTNQAVLGGTVNPEGSPTAAYFEWGATTNYGTKTAAQLFAADFSPMPVTAQLTSLMTETVYHYRLVASNSIGTSFGADLTVMPTRLLNLGPGESWTYSFHDLPYCCQYFLSDAPQSRISVGYLPGSFAPGGVMLVEAFPGAPSDPFSGGLAFTTSNGVFWPMYPSTLWADDLAGSVRLTMLTGSVVVTSLSIQQWGIRTGSAPDYHNTIVPAKFLQSPTLGMQFANNLNPNTTMVGADINANNLATEARVEWGTTTNYGFTAALATLDFDYPVQRSITLSNLNPGSLYHARVVATNSAGATFGRDLPFAAGIATPSITSTRQQGVQILIQGVGTPGTNYTLESSTTLTNWTAVTNVTADPSGAFSVIQGGSSPANRYFRIRWP